MKQLILGLLICVPSTSAIAQDGWKPIYPTPVKYFGVSSADTVSVIDASRVMLSGDGGKTWHQTGVLPTPVDTPLGGGGTRSVRFNTLKMQTAYDILFSVSVRYNPPSAQGDIQGYLYHSTDAGATWSIRSYGSYIAPIQHIAKITDTSFFGFGAPVWNSSEMNWMLTASFCVWIGDSLRSGGFTDSLAFARAFTAVGGKVYLHVEDTTYRSDLSLESWERVQASESGFTRVDTNVILSGSSRSTDEGKTWHKVNTPTGWLYGSTVGVAWVVADTLFRTSDAGLTWYPIPLAPRFMDIKTVTRDVAFGHGNDSIIYRTSTGGLQLDVTKSETEPHSVTLYPNPATYFLRSQKKITWFDLLGRSYDVPSESLDDEYLYDVRELNPGIYIVRFEGGSQMVVVH